MIIDSTSHSPFLSPLTALDLAVRPLCAAPQRSVVDDLSLHAGRPVQAPGEPTSRKLLPPLPCIIDKLTNTLLTPQGITYIGLGTLGEGNCGSVILAIQQGAAGGRLVALKYVPIKRGKLDADKALQKCLSEFEIMHASGSDMTPSELFLSNANRRIHGSLCAVMPPMHGDALDVSTALRVRAPEVASLWGRHLLAELLPGIATMHERGYMHTDIKPDNILVDFDGKPHLADYGLASPIIEEKQTLRGSYEYAAPEQLSSGREPFDDRVDVFALAITILSIVADNPVRGAVKSVGQWEAVELRRDLANWHQEELVHNGPHPPVKGRRLPYRQHVQKSMERARKLAPDVFPLLVSMLAINKHARPNAREALADFERRGLGLTHAERSTLQEKLQRIIPPQARAIFAARYN